MLNFMRYIKSWKHEENYCFKFEVNGENRFYMINSAMNNIRRYYPMKELDGWDKYYFEVTDLDEIDHKIIDEILMPYIENIRKVKEDIETNKFKEEEVTNECNSCSQNIGGCSEDHAL